MKTLKESLLSDIDDTLKQGDVAIKNEIKKHFDCFDVEIAKSAITLTYNEDNSEFQSEYRAPAILKEVPGKEKIIVKDCKMLYVRSGVTSKTIKRIVSAQPLMFIFRDGWPKNKTVEYSELKNCKIEADLIEFAYPVVFKNCTITLNNRFISFRDINSLKSISELKGLKLDTANYKPVDLDIINTALGKDIYLNKGDEKYMQKIYKVLASVFSEIIKKNRSFKVRIHRDWYITYTSISDFWHCSYGY